MIEKTDELSEEIFALEVELSNIQTEVEKVVRQNTKVVQDQEQYQNHYDKLVKNYEELQNLLAEKHSLLQLKMKQSANVKLFIDLLDKQENLLTTFNEKTFNTLVEKMVLYQNKKIEVHFKNGQVVEI